MSNPPDPSRPKGRLRSSALALAGLALLVACSETAAPPAPPMTCTFTGTLEQREARPSPFDSALVGSGADTRAKLCYSRPIARGRVIFGDLVPYDTLWRMGANEATTLHLAQDAVVAGMPVDSGAYTLYTVPSTEGWTVVVNASTGQWGLTMDAVGARGNRFPNAYTPEVRRQEVGRAPIAIEAIPAVDTLTAHFEEVGSDSLRLLVDWEQTRIVIPLQWIGS